MSALITDRHEPNQDDDRLRVANAHQWLNRTLCQLRQETHSIQDSGVRELYRISADMMLLLLRILEEYEQDIEAQRQPPD